MSQPRDSARHNKAINKQEAGFEEKGDAVLGVKPPSSLLTQSCLPSSSPDALVRVFRYRQQRGLLNKRPVTDTPGLFVSSLHR